MAGYCLSSTACCEAREFTSCGLCAKTKDCSMTNDIKTGAILIKENLPLPGDLEFKSEICVPGWKIVTDCDGSGLDRKIRKAGWNFFCLAGGVGSSAFGTDAQT